MGRRAGVIAGRVAGTLAALLACAAAASEPLDPARVGWSAVELHASKFLMSAHARIDLEERSAEAVAPVLRATPQGRPVVPGPRLVAMRYAAQLTGQDTDLELLLDAATGGAVQMTLRDSGRRERERTWRFTDTGAQHWTARPAGAAEAKLPPARWTDRNEGWRPYPPEAHGGVVTDAPGLVYALAAAPLAKPGDRWDVMVFSRRRVHRVTATVGAPMTVAAEYAERRDGRVTVRKGKLPALRVQLASAPVGAPAGDDDQFALLGMTGGIEMALDPATRVPLQLSGDAPYVGKVTFRLKAAALR